MALSIHGRKGKNLRTANKIVQRAMLRCTKHYKDSISRSHEHYLRHLLLLGQAAPLALNELIKMKESKHRTTINDMIRQCRCSTIPPESVHTKPDSWSTKTLCDVIHDLFGQELSESEAEIMKCVNVITEQITDMDKYVESAALSFEVFETKWHPLHNSLLELIKDTDSQAKFKCKRMIHSFKLESIHVNSDLIKKLRETKDVDSHVKIVIQEKLFTEIHGKREGLENMEGQDLGVNNNRQHERQDDVVDYPDDESTPYAMTIFTEQLRDTFAYVDRPAILTCKLNTANATVRWRKDFTPLEETETMKFVNSQYSHWLAISNTQLTDMGQYSCVCGYATTTASLKVSEKPLKIVKELHVKMKGTECRENMDISLVCTVNLQPRRPVWTHNSNKITDNNRIFSSSLELEHKLIIRNAQFEDEGEYTVDFGERTSSTSLTIKGNLDLSLEMQLKEELFQNWIRGSLGLKYLKIGLENVANLFIRNQHSEFLKRLSNLTVCNQCTSEKLLPFHSNNVCKNKSKCVCGQIRRRMICPVTFCSRFYDMIIDSHRFFEPLLANTDTQLWSSDPWSVATCYISTTGYKGKKSATEVDCAGLLSLFVNNTIFQKYIGEVDINGKTDVFKKAKDARNEILHNPTYELSEGQLDDFITLFKDVLEIRDEFGKSPLLTEAGVATALCNLNELQNHEIDICLRKHTSSLREHALHEEAETLMKAEGKIKKMRKAAAEKMREYRKRLKQDPEKYDDYLTKARERKLRNYVPVSQLSRAEKRKRRDKTKEYVKVHRNKRRREAEVAREAYQEAMDTSGYETSTPLVVNMSFPNRKNGPRKRISKALAKRTREFKDLKLKCAQLEKKLKSNQRSLQRYKKRQNSKTSDADPGCSFWNSTENELSGDSETEHESSNTKMIHTQELTNVSEVFKNNKEETTNNDSKQETTEKDTQQPTQDIDNQDDTDPKEINLETAKGQETSVRTPEFGKKEPSTPKTKTNQMLKRAGLNKKQIAKLRKPLLLGNVLQSQIKTCRRAMKQKESGSLRGLIGAKILSKYSRDGIFHLFYHSNVRTHLHSNVRTFELITENPINDEIAYLN